MRKLQFYFDFISNNAYLAWTQLPKLAQQHDLAIAPVPVLFAGLLKAHANVGPAEIGPKREWMGKNILRKAALLDVPLNPPLHHPFNPLLPLRACSLPMDESKRWQLIDALFQAVWVDRKHISDPGVVRDCANRAGLDGNEIIEQVSAGLASESLKQQTAEAVARGAFGIPTMLIDDELFFGYDDFVYIDLFLKGEDPLDKDRLKDWDPANSTPSAQRKERS